MDLTAANVLRTFPQWLLVASLLVFVAGFAWTVAAAPCSTIGSYLLRAGIAVGLLGALALLVRAFIAHPFRSAVAAILVLAICALEFFVSYTFTPLLCRGM